MSRNEQVSFCVELEPVEGPMVHHVIVVPEEIAMKFMQGKGSLRILCAVKDAEEFHCALSPRNGKHVIIASKQLIKKNNLLPGKPFKISVRIDPDNGLSLPEELSAVLEQDEFASEVFGALLDGQKRGFIYYIRQARSVDTRIKRCLELMEKIKQRNVL